jgi:hypothetical protein
MLAGVPCLEFIPNPATLGASELLDFRLKNWGTKWDFIGYLISETDSETVFSFDTAWSPPIAFYKSLEREGFKVNAQFNESGMCFCGSYSGGKLDSYEYNTSTIKTLEESAPDYLIELFELDLLVEG